MDEENWCCVLWWWVREKNGRVPIHPPTQMDHSDKSPPKKQKGENRKTLYSFDVFLYLFHVWIRLGDLFSPVTGNGRASGQGVNIVVDEFSK